MCATRQGRSLQRASRAPLWQQFLADLRARLAAGGSTADVPGKLVEQYAVSRHTVRAALQHLRSEGIVTAARGWRPRLASVEVEQPQGVLASLHATVVAQRMEQRSVVRVLDVRVDGVVAARLGLVESTPLVYLERLLYADEEPFALDRVWLPEDVGRPLLDADFTRTSLYAQLAMRCGVRLTGGHEYVRAAGVPEHARSWRPVRRQRDLPSRRVPVVHQRISSSARSGDVMDQFRQIATALKTARSVEAERALSPDVREDDCAPGHATPPRHLDVFSPAGGMKPSAVAAPPVLCFDAVSGQAT